MGIFFAILAPALYSIVNYVDKFLLEKYEIHPTVIAVYSGLVAFIASILIIAFTGFHGIDTRTTIIIIFSGVLTELVLLPYFKALSLDETSRVVPLFQLVPVFVLLLSFFLLSEQLTLKQYAGSALIIAASFLLSIEKLQVGIFKLRQAFWYMVLASFFAALSIVLFKLGVTDVDFWHVLPYEGFGLFLGALGILLYKNNAFVVKKMSESLPKKIFLYMAVNETFFILSRYSAFFALTFISASMVSVLNGFQPLFILLFGVILSLWFPSLIKEVINKEILTVKIVSIIIIFCGVYLLFG